MITQPEDYDYTLIGLSEWTRDTAEIMIEFLEDLAKSDSGEVPPELRRDTARLIDAYRDVWRAYYAIQSTAARANKRIEAEGETTQ